LSIFGCGFEDKAMLESNPSAKPNGDDRGDSNVGFPQLSNLRTNAINS
jgi:hypothetical protein